MAGRRCSWFCGFAVGALTAVRAEDAETCAAGQACSGEGPSTSTPGRSTSAYYWPGPHGRLEHYSSSPYEGPFDLTANLKWKWHHPAAQWADMPLGAAIDDKKNVYVSAAKGVYKLSPEGQLLWSWQPSVLPGLQQHPAGLIPNGPALEYGRLFINDFHGRFFALDMETGALVWERRAAGSGCGDTGYVAAHKGVVIAETDSKDGGNQCQVVRALNGSTGEPLWEFRPDNPVWDLMVQFDEEDTVFFQDFIGRAYRNWLFTGESIWKSGGRPGSWTDGTQLLGPNGIVYTTNTNSCFAPDCGGFTPLGPDCHGLLTAYSAATGEKLWQRETPRPPNVSPAVGKLGKGDRLSVVMPIGQQPNCESVASKFWNWLPVLSQLPGWMQLRVFKAAHMLTYWMGDYQAYLGVPALPTDVLAFDAQTGEPQWTWTGPTWRHFQCPGDERWYLERMEANVRSASCPTPWSAPRIGGDGTVYVGNQNGHFFAIKDKDGDGSIDPEKEVHDFDCGAEFSSAGSAHAPGMVVIASGDVVYAFGS